jgi:hypothetical protein
MSDTSPFLGEPDHLSSVRNASSELAVGAEDLASFSPPKIAADVSSGLAGMLASLLATSREAEPVASAEIVEPPAVKVPSAEGGLAVQNPPAFGVFVASQSRFGIDAAPPVLQDSTAAALPSTDPSFRVQVEEAPVEIVAVKPPTPRIAPPPRLRHAADQHDDIEYAQQLRGPRRKLTNSQLDVLLQSLALVKARPGEEGLPPALILISLVGSNLRIAKPLIEATSHQVQQSVRQGDKVLVVEDVGLALGCGGLFFPGDVEVMGSRIRRRALDRLTSVLQGVEFSMVMAGALGLPNEDPVDLANRAVLTLENSVAQGRHDIVVDYGENLLTKLL